VLTLAVGIGANTAIFSLLNAVLLRSFPYRNAGRLVYVFTPSHNLPPQVPIDAIGPTNGDFFDIQRQAHSFSAITLFDSRAFNFAAGGAAQRVNGAVVQSNFLSTFGVSPLFGRGIEPADTEPGREHVALISYALWQSAFGASAQVLSKSVALDGQIYRVIGVMPASFGYPSGNELPYSNAGRTQVWLPMALTPQQKADRDTSTGDAIARLRPGVIVAQGMLLTFLGIFIGIAGAFALTRLLSSLLYGIAPTDPATFIIVSGVLLAVSLLACYIPARRAMRVDPMVALRYE
jgi:hypothetical protein